MTVTVEIAPADTTSAPVRPRPAGRVVTPAGRPVGTGRARVAAGGASCAGVAARPSDTASIVESSAVQLTRRGWVLLLSVATAVAAVLVWVAYLSHPAATVQSSGPAPTRVVVQSGDTLWSIAHRVAPERDPRAVVYDLQQANHLADATVVAGQVLRVG